MNYTLHQLQVYLKIAQLQSITKAAEELYLTQPAVSIQLKNFQNQFPIPLTEVVGRQLYVTDFGKEIAISAKKILAEAAELNYKTLAYEGKLFGKLNIAIVSTAKYVMPYFLSEFLKINSGIDLQMDVTNKGKVIKNLEANEIDFAMVSTIPKTLQLEKIALMKNKLFLVGNPNYKNSNKKFNLKKLEQLPIIFREKGSATRIAMEDFLKNENIDTSKNITLTSNEAVKQAVIAGLGLSVLPLIGIKNELSNGTLEILPVKNLPIITNWNLVWLSSKKLSPQAIAFKEYLIEHKDAIIESQFNWFEKF